MLARVATVAAIASIVLLFGAPNRYTMNRDRAPSPGAVHREGLAMASDKYTSVNVLDEQHKTLKRIAEFKGIRITDLGVEIAQKFIDNFMRENEEAMNEIAELEKKMEEIRKKASGS